VDLVEESSLLLLGIVMTTGTEEGLSDDEGDEEELG